MRPPRLRVAPDLVEEAVLRELERREQEGDLAAPARYRARRDTIVDGPGARDERERTLAALHRELFDGFGFAALLEARLDEVPGLVLPEGAAIAERAPARRAEGADLFHPLAPGGRAGPPVLVLRIRPESFATPAALVTVLRRDLLHVADMLDPAFGYDPAVGAALEPPVRALVRDRYGLLWAVSVAARAAALWPEEDLLSPDRADALAACAFAALEPAAREALVRRARSPARPAHAELVGWAMAGVAGEAPSHGGVSETGAGLDGAPSAAGRAGRRLARA